MNLELKPKQSTTGISLRIPQSLLNEVTLISEATKATKSNVIVVAIAKGLQALKSPAGNPVEA